MKKAVLLPIIIIILIMCASCAKEELTPPQPPFPTVESVNSLIESVGEITDIYSAAHVSKIIEEYQFLDELSQAKVTDIQRIIDSVRTASSFFEEDDMKIKVMSFNIRYGEWGIGRQDRVLALIEQESPDIFGVQEANEAWVSLIHSRFDKSEKYAFLGTGREGRGNGEHNFVFYRKDKFNLLESNTLWLTDTPEVMSKHPESDCFRIMTYQVLERKSDGQVFIHINTHLDHVGVAARISQTQMITKWVEENYGNQFPVVITGDFNAPETTEEIQIFFKAGFENVNRDKITTRTFNAYDDSGAGGSLIDFILINDLYTDISYKVCAEKMDGEWISDHNAIVAELLVLPTYSSIELPEETEE